MGKSAAHRRGSPCPVRCFSPPPLLDQGHETSRGLRGLVLLWRAVRAWAYGADPASQRRGMAETALYPVLFQPAQIAGSALQAAMCFPGWTVFRSGGISEDRFIDPGLFIPVPAGLRSRGEGQLFAGRILAAGRRLFRRLLFSEM